MSIKEIQPVIKKRKKNFPINKILGLSDFKVAKGKTTHIPFRSRGKHHFDNLIMKCL